jgi:GNAT superfamily N-acetyltransferase
MDAGALQLLYERCSDYHEEHEGIPTRPTAAAEELAALPPGKAPADKFSFGIYSPDDEMVGYLDMVRDFPSAGEWQIGLLMLDPAVRGAGLGARIFRAAAVWVREQGGCTMSLGVLEHAAGAERFWRRMGLKEVARQPYASETGRKQSQIIFMRRGLADLQ